MDPLVTQGGPDEGEWLIVEVVIIVGGGGGGGKGVGGSGESGAASTFQQYAVHTTIVIATFP